MLELKRDGFTIELTDPTVYVDNGARGRSGHMSHALVEWAPGKLLNFNSNCSGVRHGGHSTFGYIEYRTSEDGGETYSDVKVLDYSMKELLDGVYTISIEKAVACSDGSITAFCLRNDNTALCEPWDTPTVIRSLDGGETWSDPVELCPYKGRVYAACTHNDVIYALEFCNDAEIQFVGRTEEHVYRIFTSEDHGVTFNELCVVPIDGMGRGYGAMLFDDQDHLHVFAYNINDEQHPDHIISTDCGKTWGEPTTCYLADGIRNPQIAQLDGVYLIHGRNADATGFVLYSSLDCQNWDEGYRIGTVTNLCYYSNNIVLKDKDGNNRLLIQYSERFNDTDVCTNAMHRFLRIVK